MNPIEYDDNNDTPLPDDLRQSLRAMRHDTTPDRDLWPGIAARIAGTAPAAPPQLTGARHAGSPHTESRHARRPRRLLQFAAAASLAIIVIVAWKLLPPPASSAGDRVAGLMLQEATGMTREYQAAWRTLDRRRNPDVDASALHQLDRSAAEVRAALHQDPDARFLLDRLQSVYARRLDLSRRLAAPAISTI